MYNIIAKWTIGLATMIWAVKFWHINDVTAPSSMEIIAGLLLYFLSLIILFHKSTAVHYYCPQCKLTYISRGGEPPPIMQMRKLTPEEDVQLRQELQNFIGRKFR